MRAIVHQRYGTPDVLALADVDQPVLGDADVLVRVRAAAVNPADSFTVSGTPYIARVSFGLTRPKHHIPGHTLAGQVEAVGQEVTRFQPGDEVFAEVDHGGFAEYASVPEALLAPKPAQLTFEQAAAVPLAATTALQGLRDTARLQPGQHVLINGAAGGVGTFAVQIARALGAHVSGVCSTPNVDLVRSLGANQVVDYTREDFTNQGQRWEAIFDLIGNRSLSECRRALTPNGTLVLSSGRGSLWLGPIGRILAAVLLSPFVSQRLVPLVATANTTDLVRVKELVEAGQVVPVIDRAYPLSETAAALRYTAAGHARGKVVISVS